LIDDKNQFLNLLLMMKEDIETRMAEERKKLEAQLETHSSSLGAKSKSIGTGALIVGGILVLGYIVGRKLLFSGKKGRSLTDEPSTYVMLRSPKNDSAIVRMIKEQMTMFLVAVLKERLTAFIKAADHKK
jgi:hypothetical protein